MSTCELVFFFNDTATTEIYTLSLHDALPIFGQDPLPGPHRPSQAQDLRDPLPAFRPRGPGGCGPDRKSTRLNSSHANISYAVFCLKKQKPDLLVHESHTTKLFPQHHSKTCSN